MKRVYGVVVLMMMGVSSGVVRGGEPLADRYLIEGRLEEGEKALKEALKADPKDDQARFGLGTVQFLRGVERLSQGLYRYGFRAPSFPLGLSLPVPVNPRPERIRYEDLRRLVQVWIDDLGRAEATLSEVKGTDVKMPLHVGLIRIDPDGDGKADDNTVFWKMYAQMDSRRGLNVTAGAAADFVIGFDRGDVAWLRGYCHLLMGMSEAMLAYDGKELFEHCAGLVFAKVESPYVFVNTRRLGPSNYGEIADLIAAIHLMNLPVVEPKRMPRALGHLEKVIALSRESWGFILEETDNEQEWIPNPKQDTVMPGGKVTEEMVRGWMAFLDEAEAVLAGKKRIPFWRGEGEKGVNLRKVFLEPRRFDLVMWIQGSAAMPYLEEGPRTSAETWGRFQRLFQGQFMSWALWIN